MPPLRHLRHNSPSLKFLSTVKDTELASRVHLFISIRSEAVFPQPLSLPLLLQNFSFVLSFFPSLSKYYFFFSKLCHDCLKLSRLVFRFVKQSSSLSLCSCVNSFCALVRTKRDKRLLSVTKTIHIVIGMQA